LDISKSIKIALVHSGQNQKWLAVKMGVSEAHVSDISRGSKSISLQKLSHISSIFDYKVSEFIALGE
jgi:transcriptional regulator with XRE-family HTH domain